MMKIRLGDFLAIIFLSFVILVSVSVRSSQAQEKMTATLKEFSCGDNCYLIVTDEKGNEETLICVDPLCNKWAENAGPDDNGLPPQYVGKKVEIQLSVKNVYTGGGKVAGRNISAEKLTFLDSVDDSKSNSTNSTQQGNTQPPNKIIQRTKSPLSCGYNKNKNEIFCNVVDNDVGIENIELNRGNCIAPMLDNDVIKRIEKLRKEKPTEYEKHNLLIDKVLQQKKINPDSISQAIMSMSVYSFAATQKLTPEEKQQYQQYLQDIIKIISDPRGTYNFGDKIIINTANFCDNLLEYKFTIDGYFWTWSIN